MRGLLGGLVGIILAFACGVIFSDPVRDGINNLFQGNQVVQIQEAASAKQSTEQLMGKSLPASTTNHFYATEGNRRFWIRLDVPSSDVGNVFAGAPYMTCNFPLADNYRPNFSFRGFRTSDTVAGTEWWNVGSLTQFIGGECTGVGNRTFRAMVNTASTPNWTFYLEIDNQ